MSDKNDTNSPLGVFGKYLTLWVSLSILIGIILGNAFPSIFKFISNLEYANVNFVIAILIWVMIYPMMLGVDFLSIKNVGKKPKGLCITLVVNWLIKPFTMALLGILFFEYIFKNFVDPKSAKEYIAGMIYLVLLPVQQWFLYGAN